MNCEWGRAGRDIEHRNPCQVRGRVGPVCGVEDERKYRVRLYLGGDERGDRRRYVGKVGLQVTGRDFRPLVRHGALRRTCGVA